MALISFDPRAFILSSRNALYVVGRRGTAEVRSLNIHVLHEKLRPHLDRGIDEDSLIAAAGKNWKSALQSYLNAMLKSGAFSDKARDQWSGHRTSEPGTRSFAHDWPPSSDVPGSDFLLEGEVRVSLNGINPLESRKQRVHIAFAPPEMVWRQLLSAGRSRPHAAAVAYYVVTRQWNGAASISQAEREMRAAYAKWLLLNATNLTGTSSCIRVYRLDSERGSLVRTLNFDYAQPSDFLGLPERMGMITAANVAQIPLAVATVGHDLASRSVTGFGLKQDHDLHEQLIHEFLANAILAEDETNLTGSSSSFETTLGANRIEPSRHRITAGDFSKPHCRVAPSLLHLRISLLEYCAHLRTDNIVFRNTVDLLQEEICHPQIEYLRDVLRLKIQRLPATFLITRDRLFSYEINGLCHFSFFRAKALRDALLRAVADMFYPTGYPGIGKAALSVDYATFTDRIPLRNLLRRRAAKLALRHAQTQFICQNIVCWGRNVWVGKVEEGR